MMRDRREHFWYSIIWPVLWPLLLVQAALVVLCVLISFSIWLMSPAELSWHAALWMMLALMLGSSLNAGVFLMLIKARSKQKDTRLQQALNELEWHVKAICRDQQAPLEQSASSLTAETLPLARLAAVNKALALALSQRSSVNSAGAVPSDAMPNQVLLDDLHYQQSQLKQLRAGRERAREESRLKTSYLTLLQREVDSLISRLENALESRPNPDERCSVTHVLEHLGDMRMLFNNLVEQSAIESELPPALTESSRSLRVLVVDDGPVNLMLARQLLENRNIQVDGVGSGEEALERQQVTAYDIVFMDIFMPTLDGLETTRRWRVAENSADVLPSVVIALTANLDNQTQLACEAAGMNDILAKPYPPEALFDMVIKWVPDTPREQAPS